MQQQIDNMYAASPVSNVLPQDVQRPGVATSFLYKLTEIAAYTSSFASDAYYTLTSTNGKLELEIPISANKTFGSQGQNTDGNAMQISNDISEVFNTHNVELNDNDTVQKNNNTVQKNNNNNVLTSQEIDFEVDKKDQCSWTTNDNEEEPPPPYDISWSMPTHNNETDQTLSISTHNLSDTPILSSSPKNIQSETPQTASPIDTSSTSSSTPVKRKQIRVRRPRRLLRRKSSSIDIIVQPKESKEVDDHEAFISKINEKLIDMIARGKAALKSSVYVTDVDVMLAEEKEREDRIKKEIGLQTPMNRRGRSLTGSFPDYDYYNSSISDFGNYSAPETSSYCDYGYGSGNSYSTPNEYVRHSSNSNGYSTPNEYVRHSSHSNGYSTPNEYGTPLQHLSRRSSHSNSCSTQNEYVTSLRHSSRNSSHSNGYSTQNEYVTPIRHSNYMHYSTPTQYSSYSSQSVPVPSPASSNADLYGVYVPSVGGYVPNTNFGSNTSHFGPNVPNVPNVPNAGVYGPNVSGYHRSNSVGSPVSNANNYGFDLRFGSNGLYNNQEFFY
ncbi:hypothetical protein F8M41_014741 [Gigaspora margarita]|uniref:Uncharacterized protein n=1 Tax=Gigaspora margarita TaxID=4874 RepID=A0A8H3WYD5_GIGMA|nr:hypothetical protein F8M41_014741 [Gigaspora margarita]